MSAGGALQTAVATALGAISELSGTFDGAPARAAYPYAVMDLGSESDWSHKSGEGREVALAITVWDDQPIRLHVLADQVEAAARGVTAVDGHQLVNLRLIRRRVVRDVAGPWAAAVDFRARLLADA